MSESKKILIIEDDGDLRSLIFNALQDEKLDVLEAKDGPIGLAMAREEQPDLILLDLDIPGLKGLDLLDALQKDEKNKDIAIIIFSNSANVEDLGQAMERGVIHYLAKSDWKLVDVVAKVREVLQLT